MAEAGDVAAAGQTNARAGGIRVDRQRRDLQEWRMNRRLMQAMCAVPMMASLIGAAPEPGGSRVALVVGNSRYEAEVGPLRNAVNDAKAVSKTLRGLGFSVVEERNVTRDELFEAVADFRKKIPDSEVALFYYAGHGVSVGGSNYLIPLKSRYQPVGGDDMTSRMLAETRLFNAEQIVAEMSAAGGRCNLVILDACRNTPVARDPGARDASGGGGLSVMEAPAGSLIAFATDAGHPALDGDGVNGLYTGELVKHLQTPGISIEQVFKRTRAGVMRLSGGKQLPAEYSRLIGDDIHLAGTAATTPKAEPVALPTAGEINRLAAAGRVTECAEALQLAVAANGPGDFAAAPIDAILEKAKEDLKSATGPSPAVEATEAVCRTALELIRECLPATHAKRPELSAKANNRFGDCLMWSGKSAEALTAYQNAVELAPADSYPLYNRGRAHLALGNRDAAKADLEAASNPKFNQPKARKLVLDALAEIK